MSKTAEKSEAKATIWQPSHELNTLLAMLTAGQARGIRSLIERVELGGEPIEALFVGKGKICNRTTYYKARGWLQNKRFRAVLDLAKREARAANLSGGVAEALAELQDTAPLAARDLRRQIAGDEAAIAELKSIVLGDKRGDKGKPVGVLAKTAMLDDRVIAVNSLADIGTQAAALALLECLHSAKANVRTAIITALGRASSGLSTQRRLADVAVLNRAGKETAAKGLAGADELSDDELAAIAASGDAPGSGAGIAATTPGATESD
jgi:hypothetical protein